MSRSFDGDNDSLNIESVVFNATTIETTSVAMACWIKRGRTSAAAEEMLMIGGANSLGGNYQALLINTSNQVQARTRTSSNANATGGTITDTTSWHLVVAIFAGTALRYVSIDGGSTVSDTTSRDPTTATAEFAIAGRPTTVDEFQGLMAYPTVWTGLSKTQAEWNTFCANLWNNGSGVDPKTIENANCIAHWDLTGNESPEVDDVGTFDLIVNNTTFSTDNPFTVGGGEDFTLPVAVNFAVFEASVISLLGPAAVLPVTPGSAVFEAQQLPFILAQPGQHGEAVFEGQDVTLLTPNSFTLPVVEIAGVFAGQAISLSHTQSIVAGVAFAVFAGQDIGLRVPFVTGGGTIKPRDLRRRFIRLLGR